jgi:ATP-binding cassette subfamily G (WHITE) protein 2 (SNQ2)
MQPYMHLGWWKWMYRTSPWTYLLEGFVGQGIYRSRIVDSRSIPTALSALGHSQITCAPVEYVTIKPPQTQTCQQYLSEFISTAGGYVMNPSDNDNCQFCSYRTSDEFLQSNSNIFWSHHWRNLGFMWIYIGFNVRPC